MTSTGVIQVVSDMYRLWFFTARGFDDTSFFFAVILVKLDMIPKGTI